MSNNPEYGRRHFLKDSVLSFARTAQEYIKHRDAPSEPRTNVPERTDWLRPPGAVSEPEFLERCTKCGDCVEACPYQSIRPHEQTGFPVVYADEAPCRVCEDLPCIAACATEALLPVDGPQDVRMGLAVVSARDCTAEQGCHACVTQCPVHALDLDFSALRLVVHDDRCVGCGMCVYVCKTVNDRLAIRVTRARTT